MYCSLVLRFDYGDFRNLKDKRALIISSAGGHLSEAIALHKILELSPESFFISHENEQSQSQLNTFAHAFVPFLNSRSYIRSLLAIHGLLKISRQVKFDVIISTGAAISIPSVAIHLLSKKQYLYFESLTRISGPSLSGKLLGFFPSVERFTPHISKFSTRWKTAPSIAHGYSPVARAHQKTESGLKVLVILGTSAFRFDRMIDSVLGVTNALDEVTWQYGCTDRIELPGLSKALFHNGELSDLAKRSDVVICHGGIGTILDMLGLGIRPIVLPRNSLYKEHIDEHQLEAASYFQSLGLIHLIDGSLTRETLFEASKIGIILNG
jgi:UDP-N-acetylglucosamine--N-acetylmuramyl-(pentapeptide) pyrophosphoryl-undecaprenol N-acetylglucosamine transferase